MADSVFDIKRLSFDEVHNLLLRMSDCFTPPLSQGVDIQEYSKKLASYANFLTCEENGQVLGFIAYYQNYAAKQIYITLICVDEKFQRSGIGAKLLERLQQVAKGSGKKYQSIGLEVNKVNSKAHCFYVKYGFVEQEDRGEKLLMEKTL
jgi:ribosomal protein S18 acetylase RimI-like enzyme